MSDDLLHRAAKALRDQTAETGGLDSRRAVLDRVDARQRASARRVAVLVPLVAVVVASTAIAAATGVLPKAWQALTEAIQPQPPPPPPPRAPVHASSDRVHARALAATPEPAPAPPPVPEPAPPEPAAAQAPIGTPEPARHVPTRRHDRVEAVETSTHPLIAPEPAAAPPNPEPAAPAPAVQAVPPASAPQPTPATGEDTLALFRAAQRLHFGEHAWARALTAWDAYLRAAPHGDLAPEARWNRALCLVRLGRAKEARRALEPFATGGEAGYRQAEAQSLLEALPADASGH
jgi:hypothetical protein